MVMEVQNQTHCPSSACQPCQLNDLLVIHCQYLNSCAQEDPEVDEMALEALEVVELGLTSLDQA